MKDKGNQSFKSCGLWLPVGVTWSGFACGAAGLGGAAVHVCSGGFSEWRTGQGCCVWSWSSLLLVEMFPLAVLSI